VSANLTLHLRKLDGGQVAAHYADSFERVWDAAKPWHGGNLMAAGRTEYLNDPEAPKPNSLVPAAGVLAVDPDGRVLLQRRRDTGQWAIPMGKQEIGETATQCAQRETHEETGVTVKVTGLLGIFSDPGHVVVYHSNGETRQWKWERGLH